VGLERDVVGATRALFATNVDGVFNTILPLIAPMKERKSGRIVLMSSLASVGPMPGAVAYSATKAAVRTYGEALRGLLYRDGVRVSVVCPGYTESEMTKANHNHMVGLMPMAQAVRIIASGIKRDVPVIIFPSALVTAFWLIARVLPPPLLHALSRRRLSPMPPTNYLRKRRESKKKQ
jgi:short-subunit dehydrogenase